MSEQNSSPASAKRPKSQRTKELLYHTAMDMLVERGFQATTIREICKQAGVSVGTFYSYFDSKYAILFEVIRKIDHYFVDEVHPKLEGLPVAEQIRVYFQEYGKYMEHSNFETVCVIYSVQDIWLTRYRPLHRVLTSILQAGQLAGEVTMEFTAERLCDYFFSGVRGIVFTWCTANSNFTVTERIDDFVDFLLGRIAPQEPTVQA